ncbi:MAG: FmdB family zinc ribbon protein [Vicinamibacterales bacterium]
MPIFEYVCRDCHHAFETLVQGERKVVCPACSSEALDKQLSVFAVNARGSADSTVDSTFPASGACGACGDPRGPGSCSMN